ncbi:MAG: MATE family multidrug resistance protein [Candidatus Azotimanducaceae bacterium]|jgi:MATE family multidrug resistance protein
MTTEPANQKRVAKKSKYVIEIRRLFHIALPLMGAQLAQMGMGVSDAIMAGQYNSADLAGVALGGSLLWPVMLLIMGLIQAVTPTVAQLNGRKDYAEIGEVIRQGLWMAIGGGFIGVLILNNIGPVYTWLDVDPVASNISIPYLTMASLGFPALMCFFCLRFLADGMGFTRPAMYIAISALCLKIPLNYVLIYGKFGLPEMGGVGCGLANAIINWFQLLMIILVVSQRRFDITGWRKRLTLPDWTRIKPLLIIGLPIGASIFSEVGLFSFTTLLLGRFGADTVAAHNIAMNLNGVLFMPAMALGMAATIRIGFRVGAAEITDARITAALAIATTVVIALLGSVFIYFFRFDLANLYTQDSNIADQASVLLLFVTFFLIFDAIQSTSAGALRGFKDTRVPMWIAIFSFWVIGLPMECILGFGWIGEPMGVYGFWIGLSIGVGTAALLLSIRLWQTSNDYARIEKLAR